MIEILLLFLDLSSYSQQKQEQEVFFNGIFETLATIESSSVTELEIIDVDSYNIEGFESRTI